MTYQFKVQAKNSYGLSAYSSVKSVLTAQKPDDPSAPITEIDGTYVKVFWDEPFNGGYAISSYTIKLMQVDGISYSQDLTNCNGASVSVVSSLLCYIPVTTLM